MNCGVLPFNFLIVSFATILAIISLASNVALPICGVSTTFLSDFNSSVILGSNSYTSNAAPSISLSCKAFTSAC